MQQQRNKYKSFEVKVKFGRESDLNWTVASIWSCWNGGEERRKTKIDMNGGGSEPMKFVTTPSFSSLAFTAGYCFSSDYLSSPLSCKKRKNRNLFIVSAGRKQSRSPSSSPEDSDPAPPRITANVKQNLQFLRLWKEFQKRKSSTPKPATSYRRKKVEKEDLPEDTELYQDPTLTLYYTHQGIDNAVPVLLVDGYNVCGYWPKLKKHFLGGSLAVARQKLIDELINFSALREVKVVAVFDAMLSGLPTHKETFAGIDIIYSGETCADTWIEKEVVALREDGCPKVWVVTSDHSQQHAAYGAGAFIWSCKALVSEIKASKKEVERMLREQRPSSFQGKLLKHNLDSEVVDALKDLRNKLYESESVSK